MRTLHAGGSRGRTSRSRLIYELDEDYLFQVGRWTRCVDGQILMIENIVLRVSHHQPKFVDVQPDRA